MATVTVLGTVTATASDRARVRRKAFEVVRALGGARETATRVAGEISDAIRTADARSWAARLTVATEPRPTGVAVTFSLVRDAAPAVAGAPAAPASGAPQPGGPGRTAWTHTLRAATPSAGALDRARAILAGRSREELFASLEATNAALRRTTTEARVAAEAKAQFLANMSHEIRTPLNAIIGMNRLALAGEPAPRLRSYLEKVETSGRHLLGIIDDILDVSKLDAGKLLLERGELAIGRVLDDVTTLAGGACAEKGLRLSVEVADDVPGLVVGDALRLRQVLLNLVTNAVKFTSEGGVAISVRRWAPSGDDLGLRFEVRDTGIGLTAPQMEQLFTSFHQADATITRRFGGTGLGLAISRRLAELMGGSIGAESRHGEGSTFWFTARVGQVDPPLPAAVLDPAARGVPAAAGPDLDPSARILVVEDNGLNQEVALGLLAEVGLHAVVVGDGLQALEALRRERFDLVFMDVQMPVMDGLTATRRIRHDLRLHSLPVIAMTANVLPSARRACLDAGMNDVVTKPIEPEALAHALATWLAAPAGAQTVRPAAEPSEPADDGLLTGIPGLDAQRGLRYARGRRDLYLRLLRGFFDDQRTLPEQLLRALGEDDAQTLARLAHTVRGLASGLGAGEIAETAEDLERLLKGGAVDARSRAAAAALMRAHERVFRVLEHRWLGDEPPGIGRKPA